MPLLCKLCLKNVVNRFLVEEINCHLAGSVEPAFCMRAQASLIQKPGRATRRLAGGAAAIAAKPPVVVKE